VSTGAVTAVPVGTAPLPILRAARHRAVPLVERNLPAAERRAPDTVADRFAAPCAQVAMDTYPIAVRRRGDRREESQVPWMGPSPA